MTELPARLALPGRLPAAASRRRRSPRCSPSAGERQLHVAETEKYAHVTYFFNGGREQRVGGGGAPPGRLAARRADLRPQARDERARRGRAFVERWADGGYRFGIINFANPDMVGHTGDIPAAVAAIEAVDACLGEVVAAVHGSGGACIVTADHGNADKCSSPTARRTPPTRLTRCPSSSRVAGLGSRRRDPGRRRPDRARAARDRPAGGDDGPLADRALRDACRLTSAARGSTMLCGVRGQLDFMGSARHLALGVLFSRSRQPFSPSRQVLRLRRRSGKPDRVSRAWAESRSPSFRTRPPARRPHTRFRPAAA